MGYDKASGNLAIFDFDKTLVSRDSFRVFSTHAATTYREQLKVMMLAAMCKLRLIDNESYKTSVLGRVWTNRSTSDQRDILATFMDRMHALENDAVVRYLRHHLANHDRVAVVSASPDFYLRPFVSTWSTDIEVVASTVHRTGTKTVVNNMYGARKAAIVSALIGECKPHNVMVYTDHDSDLPLIRLANEVRLVRPSARLVRNVRKLQIPFELIRT